MGTIKTTHPQTLKSNRRRECLKQHYRRTEGRQFSVPAEQVQKHLQRLFDAGFSTQAIAVVAGCADATLVKIMRGERQRVSLYIANGIFKVGLTPVPAMAGRKVPSIGVVRRMHALRRTGWTVADVAKAAGRSHVSATNITSHGLRSVEYETWADYARAYEELSSRRGPSRLSEIRSAREKWPSPWDWETANIDDPLSYPLKAEGPSRGMLKRQAAALDKPGVSASDLAERLGVSQRTIVRWRTERGSGAEKIGGERKTV